MGFLDRLFWPPSKKRFARMVMRRLRATGHAGRLEFDPGEFQIRILEPQGQTLFLGNIYDEYCAAPKEDRDPMVDRFIALSHAMEFPKDREEAIPNILPRIRERMYYANIRLLLKLRDHAQDIRPLRVVADHLAVGLCYDFPDAISELQPKHLEDWGLKEGEALDIGMRNLRAMSREPFECPTAGLFVSPWKDSHDATRLLLTDLISGLPVRGEPVAMVPNRDTLLVTGSRDKEGVEAMFKMADEVLNGPRPMFGIPFVLSEGAWTVLETPPGDEILGPLHGCRTIWFARECEEQREELEKIHEKEGRDIYTAKVSATQHEATREIRSYAVWSEGIPTLLPKADDIVLGPADESGEIQVESMVRVPWERVREVAGDLMKREIEYPERWLVERFPAREALGKLRDEVNGKGPQ